MTAPNIAALGTDPRNWTDAFMSGPVNRASFADIDAWLAFQTDVNAWFTAALKQPLDQGSDDLTDSTGASSSHGEAE